MSSRIRCESSVSMGMDSIKRTDKLRQLRRGSDSSTRFFSNLSRYPSWVGQPEKDHWLEADTDLQGRRSAGQRDGNAGGVNTSSLRLLVH